MRLAASASVALLSLGLVGCAAPAPLPTPTPLAVPTATSVPSPTAEAQAGAVPSDVENAFLSNIDDLVAEAADLTVTPCADLIALTTDNPTLVASIHGFAATLERVGSTRPELDTESVHAALSDMDHSISQLDGALSACGIKPT